MTWELQKKLQNDKDTLEVSLKENQILYGTPTVFACYLFKDIFAQTWLYGIRSIYNASTSFMEEKILN